MIHRPITIKPLLAGPGYQGETKRVFQMKIENVINYNRSGILHLSFNQHQSHQHTQIYNNSIKRGTE